MSTSVSHLRCCGLHHERCSDVSDDPRTVLSCSVRCTTPCWPIDNSFLSCLPDPLRGCCFVLHLSPGSESTCEKSELLISVFVKNLLTDARSEPAEIISTLDKVQDTSDAQQRLLVTKLTGVSRSLEQRTLPVPRKGAGERAEVSFSILRPSSLTGTPAMPWAKDSDGNFPVGHCAEAQPHVSSIRRLVFTSHSSLVSGNTLQGSWPIPFPANCQWNTRQLRYSWENVASWSIWGAQRDGQYEKGCGLLPIDLGCGRVPFPQPRKGDLWRLGSTSSRRLLWRKIERSLRDRSQLGGGGSWRQTKRWGWCHCVDSARDGRPPDVRCDIQILGTGIRPMAWPRSVRRVCLRLGRDQLDECAYSLSEVSPFSVLTACRRSVLISIDRVVQLPARWCFLRSRLCVHVQVFAEDSACSVAWHRKQTLRSWKSERLLRRERDCLLV